MPEPEASATSASRLPELPAFHLAKRLPATPIQTRVYFFTSCIARKSARTRYLQREVKDSSTTRCTSHFPKAMDSSTKFLWAGQRLVQRRTRIAIFGLLPHEVNKVTPAPCAVDSSSRASVGMRSIEAAVDNLSSESDTGRLSYPSHGCSLRVRVCEIHKGPPHARSSMASVLCGIVRILNKEMAMSVEAIYTQAGKKTKRLEHHDISYLARLLKEAGRREKNCHE